MARSDCWSWSLFEKPDEKIIWHLRRQTSHGWPSQNGYGLGQVWRAGLQLSLGYRRFAVSGWRRDCKIHESGFLLPSQLSTYLYTRLGTWVCSAWRGVILGIPVTVHLPNPIPTAAKHHGYETKELCHASCVGIFHSNGLTQPSRTRLDSFLAIIHQRIAKFCFQCNSG